MLRMLPYAWIPLLITGVPLLAGRIAAHIGSKRMYRLTLLTAVALALGAGVFLFGERVAGVTLATAVTTATVASCLLVLFPVGVFAELGYRFRSAIGLGVVWLLFALPLPFYGFIVLFVAGAELSCPGGPSTCFS